MRLDIPKNHNQWVEEVEAALDEALLVQKESVGTEIEIDEKDIYKMAAVIAGIYRSIKDEKTKDKLIQNSWSSVQHVHAVIPEYKEKYRRCFVHAYLDSMICLKYMTRLKAENIIDHLESKGDIELG